jgi:pimeloyl-ACP methyl ester carboxylesterase
MSKIFVTQRGSGAPLILIHGFPLHSGVWANFSKRLSQSFTVYTPDLPGFGKSPALTNPFCIEDVADVVIEWLRAENLRSVTLIGHSLGGYIALAIAEKTPELLSGFGLFHSTASADSEEKKQSRDKVIDFIDKNGVETFTSNFIAPLFFNQKHPAIDKVRDISRQSKADSVKGYTIAMRNRPDRKNVLTGFPKPILFMGGENDPGIAGDSLKEQAAMCKDSELHILAKVAHMAMFENEEKSIEIISVFMRKVAVTS